MAQSAALSLQHSDLNSFLFADVGPEPSGMPLTVVSLFGRLGCDPWREAARLAALPRAEAKEGLARSISSLPELSWAPAEISATASRLVALLPRRGQPEAAPRAARAPRMPPQWLAYRNMVAPALCAILAVVLLLSLLTGWRP